MSKPLATKVNTPHCENVQFGPLVSILPHQCHVTHLCSKVSGVLTFCVPALMLIWVLKVQYGTSWQRTLHGALKKDSLENKNIDNILKWGCSTVAKTIPSIIK